MLQEAVTRALRGEWVLVLAINRIMAVYLKRVARDSVASTQIQHETEDRLVFGGGGNLNFQSRERKYVTRGFSGVVYVMKEDHVSRDHARSMDSPPYLTSGIPESLPAVPNDYAGEWEVDLQFFRPSGTPPEACRLKTRFERIADDDD